jgi:hypothetical protein
VDYLAWLNWLIALGPKLPAVYAEIEKIVASVKAIIELFGGAPAADGTLALASVSTAEAEAEIQVAALLAGPNAAFDGTRLRAIFQFLNENRELLKFLVSLFGGPTLPVTEGG